MFYLPVFKIMNWCLSTSKFVFKYFEHMSLNIWWVSTNCSCYYYVYCPVGASLSWILNPSDKTLIIFYSLLSSMKRNTPFYRTNSLLHFKWWFNIPQKRHMQIYCVKWGLPVLHFLKISATLFFQNLLLYHHTAYFLQYGQMVTCITELLLIHSTILSTL